MMRNVLSVIGLVVILAVMALPPVAAQQSVGVSKKTAVKSQPTMAAAARAECGDDCEDAESRLAAPTGGGSRDYECAGDNCSCAGAADCVAMKKICAPGTLTCNDYGCTCAQAPEPEGNGG